MNVGGPENQPLQQVTQGVLVADCDVPSFAISMCRQRKYAICELLSAGYICIYPWIILAGLKQEERKVIPADSNPCISFSSSRIKYVDDES